MVSSFEPHSKRSADGSQDAAETNASPRRPSEDNDLQTCCLCGGEMTGVHCKMICSNCGYREDCSDLFPA